MKNGSRRETAIERGAANECKDAGMVRGREGGREVQTKK